MNVHRSSKSSSSSVSVVTQSGRIVVSSSTSDALSRAAIEIDESRAKRSRRGINVAGLEFGTDPNNPNNPGGRVFSNREPGGPAGQRDFTGNSERTYAYFASKGIRLFRIPFRWERIQALLGGELVDDYLNLLKQQVIFAKNCDAKIILDLHNYGAYWLNPSVAIPIDSSQREEIGIGSPALTADHFVNLWSRLSDVFGSESTVDAYGLMNEPHRVNDDWHSLSQKAVDAIRNKGDHKTILVSGRRFASAHTWPLDNGDRPWIADPIGNHVYEAHCYFDSSNSGVYNQSFQQEYSFDQRIEYRGVERIATFVNWCQENHVRGFVGEFGIPQNDPGWLAVLDRFLEAIDRAGMPSCYWAAGEWWGGYPLSIQPRLDFRQSVPALDHLLR